MRERRHHFLEVRARLCEGCTEAGQAPPLSASHSSQATKPGGPGGPWRPPSQTLMGDLSVLPFKTTSPVCVRYSSVIIET